MLEGLEAFIFSEGDIHWKGWNVSMFCWCDDCQAVCFDGLCEKHGRVRPIATINPMDIRPLTELEKKLLNSKLRDQKNVSLLGEGVFLTCRDRSYHRQVIVLDKPIMYVRSLKHKGLLVEGAPQGDGYIQGMDKDSLIKANSSRMRRLVGVSKSFSQHEIENKGDKCALISFSGGKDSSALAHLLRDFHLEMIFADTTIEFPETHLFIKRLQNDGHKINITRAESSFFQLVKSEGFPASGNRWCCKTQKFDPIGRYLKERYGDEHVLVFTGQRRWETLGRLCQPFVKMHKYMPTQITIQPMLDWLAMDIWIYLWHHNVQVNPLYEFYGRVGCWPCPFGLQYRKNLLVNAHPGYYKTLKRFGVLKGAEPSENIRNLLGPSSEAPCRQTIESILAPLDE